MSYSKIIFPDKQQGTVPENIHEQEIWFSDVNEIKTKFGLLIDALDQRDSLVTAELEKSLKKIQAAGIANRFFIIDEFGNISIDSSIINDSLSTSLFKTWSIDKLLATFIDQTELDAALAALVDSAPGTLDTLNELAEALGDDPNFATTTAAALGNRLRFDIDDQGLSTTQKTNALANLGISAKEIIASGAVFAWHKKPSNSTATLAATEIITNGRISDTIHIKSAEYVSGDINTFGTLAGFFKDGSYKKVEYRNF